MRWRATWMPPRLETFRWTVVLAAGSGCGDLLEAGPVTCDGPGGVVGEVVPQVPAVSDLDGARGSGAGAF
jgi:hypothetical protein